MPRVRKYNSSKDSRRSSYGKRRKSNQFSLWSFLLKLFAIAGAISLLLSYISVFLPPSDAASVLMFFGLYFIPIFIFNLLIFIIALISLNSVAIMTFVVMLPTLFFADLFVKLGKEAPVPDGEPFKILTYNVGRMRLSSNGLEAAANAARIENFIEQEQPDVLCMQEFSLTDKAAYERYIQGMPYRHQYFFGNDRSFFGNVILSKYPIGESGIIRFDHSRNMCVWSDIAFPDDTVRVYNCHLQSSTISFTNLIQRLATKGELTSEVREVHVKLRDANKIRANQVEEILAHCGECRYPVIICGDFNDTPVSHTYNKLQRGRKDSFAEAGKGFGASYSYLWPLLRIDYILLPKEFTAYQNVIKKEVYSDHYPVSTYIYK